MISYLDFSFQWAPIVGMLSMMFLLSTRTSYTEQLQNLYGFYFVGDELIMILHNNAHYQYVKEKDGVAAHNYNR